MVPKFRFTAINCSILKNILRILQLCYAFLNVVLRAGLSLYILLFILKVIMFIFKRTITYP